MTEDCDCRAAFVRALTLAERTRLATPLQGQEAGEHAKEVAACWRAEPAFDSAISFEERLALEGIETEAFMAALESPAVLAGQWTQAPPMWWSELQDAAPRVQTGDETAALASRALLNAIAAPIGHARERVREALDGLSAGVADTDCLQRLEQMLVSQLEDRLLWMVRRTFVLELQVASLRGLLSGATAEERFASFTSSLRDADTMLRLFDEYPVLGRAIVAATERWTEVSVELIERLVADWPEISNAIFKSREVGSLVAIDGGSGDVHRGGRAVRILRFASGERLVYKPRSLAIDRHLQELLAWLNGKGYRPAFRVLTVLDHGTYGWSEFASAGPCRSRSGVERFYRRLGGYLSLLYALEATDFHHENLIAAGEDPVLADVEALFQPRLSEPDSRQAHAVAWSAIDHSVLRVGLLPQWRGRGDAQLDVSGIGGAAGQLTPYEVPLWENEGTDAMRLVRRRLVMRGAANRPTLKGAEVNPALYSDAIVDGFTGMYRLLLEHRDELLAAAGPLARFGQDEVRMLLRTTRTYAMLLRESFHPDVLRDGLARERLFDRLWVVGRSSPRILPAVPSERRDLSRGDIPLFTTRPGSRDLSDSDGRTIEEFFDEPSMDQVRRRVLRLAEDDLVRQRWFIRASLSTLAPPDQPYRPPRQPRGDRVEPATSESLIAAARAVGDRLEALALRGEDDATWIGLSITGGERWSLRALGIDLYDGLPGVALFLGYLGALTGQRRYGDLARAAIETVRHQVGMLRPSHASVGAFDGWSGVIYALTHLGTLWGDSALVTEAAELASTLPGLLQEDSNFDVVGGAAGAAAVLAGLNQVLPSDVFMTAATRAGERLLETASELPGGIGWRKDTVGAQALAGFSHGAAGIAWSLVRLGTASGQERFLNAAQSAIGYERGLFCKREGNWRDLRLHGEGEDRFRSSWCHGATGIGLARLVSREFLDEHADTEIEVALRTTIARGLSTSHTLCHGSLGNLELILEASRRLDHSRWQPHLTRLASQALEEIARHGWYCGTSQGIESPGLMTGLAGIGYGLLRLAEADAVPSVLTLEPPLPAATRAPLRKVAQAAI